MIDACVIEDKTTRFISDEKMKSSRKGLSPALCTAHSFAYQNVSTFSETTRKYEKNRMKSSIFVAMIKHQSSFERTVLAVNSTYSTHESVSLFRIPLEECRDSSFNSSCRKTSDSADIGAGSH